MTIILTLTIVSAFSALVGWLARGERVRVVTKHTILLVPAEPVSETQADHYCHSAGFGVTYFGSVDELIDSTRG